MRAWLVGAYRGAQFIVEAGHQPPLKAADSYVSGTMKTSAVRCENLPTRNALIYTKSRAREFSHARETLEPPHLNMLSAET